MSMQAYIQSGSVCKTRRSLQLRPLERNIDEISRALSEISGIREAFGLGFTSSTSAATHPPDWTHIHPAPRAGPSMDASSSSAPASSAAVRPVGSGVFLWKILEGH